MLQRKHMESLRRWPMDMFEKFYEERLQEEKNKPVECLGITFESDEKRREYLLKKLREKLKEPELRTFCTNVPLDRELQ